LIRAGSPAVRLLAGSIASLLPMHASQAAPFAWIPTAAGTTYEWNTTIQDNWGTGVTGWFPNATDDIANLNLNLVGAQTISLNQAVTLGTLNLGDTTTAFVATTLQDGTGGSLTFDVASGSAAINKGTAASTSADTISAPLTLNDNLVVTNAATATTGALTLSGNIGDGTTSKGLTKLGVGTLTLSGTNKYAGNTAIDAGTLVIAGTGSLPGWDTASRYSVASSAVLAVADAVADDHIATLHGTGNFAAGAALGFDTTSGERNYSPVLTDTEAGALGLVKLGANALTLSGANTHTGGTILTTGTVRIGVESIGEVDAITSGALGSGMLTFNGGTLSSDSATARTILNPVALTGNAGFGDGANLGTLTFSAAGNLGPTKTLTVATGTTAQFDGILTGSGITFNGPGTLVLTMANTFSSTFTMNGTGTGTAAGTVRITRADVFGSAGLSWNGNPRTVLELDGSGGNINFTKNLGTTSGYILRNVAGSNTVTSGLNMYTGAGGTKVASDGGVLALTGAIQAGQGPRQLELAGSSTGANTVSGLISTGNGTSLLKSGTGTWTLTNANTYALTTKVSGGTLLVNNTSGSGTGTSAVTVGAAGTLGGSGTISGIVTVDAGGTLRLGASGSTLSLSNATAPTFTAFATLRVLASAGTLDQISLTNATPVFTCDNLDLVIDTTDLTGNVTGATIVRTANTAGISGTFHSVTVIGNTAYTATVHYNTTLGTITLDLTSGDNPFELWATITHGLSGAAAAAAADPDADGLTNLLEFVLGDEPNPANTGSNSVSLLPQATTSGGNLLFTYRLTDLSLTQPGIAITTEYGSDLTGWDTAQNGVDGVTITVTNDFYATGIDKVEVAIPQALATRTSLFARLKVTQL
jgi:autotransporter-associated beta strand protein